MRFKRLKPKKEVVKLRFQKMAQNFFMAFKSKFELSRLSKSHSRKRKERFCISIIVTSVPNIDWSSAFWIFPWDSSILSVWPLVLPLSVGAEPLFTILSVCLFASLQTFVSKSQKFIFKTNKIDRRQIQPLNLPWRRPHGNRLARLPPTVTIWTWERMAVWLCACHTHLNCQMTCLMTTKSQNRCFPYFEQNCRRVLDWRGWHHHGHEHGTPTFGGTAAAATVDDSVCTSRYMMMFSKSTNISSQYFPIPIIK